MIEKMFFFCAFNAVHFNMYRGTGTFSGTLEFF